MSQLFLLRHAKADWAKPGMRDFDRPLKERGRKNAETIGTAMHAAGFVPDRVICSKAARAVETWESVSTTLIADGCKVEFTDALYGSDASGYLRVVNEVFDSDRMLLIGHNPMMEDIAFALAGDGDEAALANLEKGFPTAGMAAIKFATPLCEVSPGKGILEAFLTPSDL